MPSVVVTWKGTCAVPMQLDLVKHLRLLAASNAELMGVPQSEPAESDSVELIRLYDHEITGNLVVDPELVVDLQSLVEEIRQTNCELVELGPAGAELRQIGLIQQLSTSADSDRECLRVARMHLFGIDFKLAQCNYRGEDRVSFVFLDPVELPSLRGCVAQIHSHAQCELFKSQTIRDADWFLTTPKLHLRYAWEGWIDTFLSWIKYFFMPDMYYWHWEEFAGYRENASRFDGLCAQIGKDAARQSAFDDLSAAFKLG